MNLIAHNLGWPRLFETKKLKQAKVDPGQELDLSARPDFVAERMLLELDGGLSNNDKFCFMWICV